MPPTARLAASNPSTAVGVERLITLGALAVLAASAVNLLVLELALALVDVPASFVPLPLGRVPVVASSAVGAIGATVAYGVIARYAARPNRTFTRVAAGVWILSYGNLLTPALTGAPGTVYATLGVMHVTAAVVIVAILRRTPTPQAHTAAGTQ